ncbi:hypothetical protein EG19_08150 [Thermoanaerobaculum aquaticum]|uniref:DUF58 domain-containing protein n=1 Tax=Thermoanaerobaculum aquaticum TaxID=1312852 RepID=A0A062XKK1_9BACT|nr:DUF58 domain-containing protein [Thermoanaerobaculum aquaticum]KDA53077.1 hypothetical protein EG19_08150 [Thermoanaerobaculum aquaticum]
MGWISALEWRFPGFSLTPTRAFWWFLVWVAVLGVSALNTGNNALYMLLALSLGAFVASGVLSRHTLGHLQGETLWPAEVWASAATRVQVVVHNTSRFLPAWGVVCRLSGLPGGLVLPLVPPRGKVTVPLLTRFPARGLFPRPHLTLEVRLPLGFFVKSLNISQPGELLVYPRLVAAALPRFSGPPQGIQERGTARLQRGGEVELLREFRPGDDLRDVHWKQTARQGRVIVMERRERERSLRFLVLDPHVRDPEDPETRRRFEDLVAEVASVARKLVHTGQAVGLVVGERVLPPAWGPEHLRKVLTLLALVQPVRGAAGTIFLTQGEQAVYRLAGSS